MALHTGRTRTERDKSQLDKSLHPAEPLDVETVEFREIGNTGLPLQTGMEVTYPPETRVCSEGSLFVKGD